MSVLASTATLNILAAEIHENAKAHGWWDEERTFGEIIALCHSELSEALEEFRDGNPFSYFYKTQTIGGVEHKYKESDFISQYDGEKPEGVAFELADTIIRILDYCGKENIDIATAIRIKHEFNKTRPYKHGGKKI